jgi:hypothetical protein
LAKERKAAMRRKGVALVVGLVLMMMGAAAPASADPGCKDFGQTVAWNARGGDTGVHGLGDVVPEWAQDPGMDVMVNVFKDLTCTE